MFNSIGVERPESEEQDESSRVLTLSEAFSMALVRIPWASSLFLRETWVYENVEVSFTFARLRVDEHIERIPSPSQKSAFPSLPSFCLLGYSVSPQPGDEHGDVAPVPCLQ